MVARNISMQKVPVTGVEPTAVVLERVVCWTTSQKAKKLKAEKPKSYLPVPARLALNSQEGVSPLLTKILLWVIKANKHLAAHLLSCELSTYCTSTRPRRQLDPWTDPRLLAAQIHVCIV